MWHGHLVRVPFVSDTPVAPQNESLRKIENARFAIMFQKTKVVMDFDPQKHKSVRQ
jgi:hypothetical protein